MTDNEQTIELAKLDGWGVDVISKAKYNFEQFFNKDGRACASLNSLPPYLTSRDIVVPVIEKQSRLIKRQVLYFLSSGCVNAEAHLMVVLLATPRQLCEALLRATGKWK